MQTRQQREFALEAGGLLACWTRPELSTERVSYAHPTHSGLRGVVESIYWKPQIQWEILRVEVLKPVQWFGLTRNEIKDTIPYTTVMSWGKPVKEGKKPPNTHYFVDERRTQRHTLMLWDVRYRIVATPHLVEGDNPIKHWEIIRRRLRKGQCFRQPYLGCREFWAEFSLPTNQEPIQESGDLGTMFYDFVQYDKWKNPSTPIFWDARMENGVIHFPHELFEQRRGLS